ncbi:MAG: hypothetical protein IPO04_15710 [Cytophagaceae bacterium]|nr:hypothetical protein [Cytophagaceae bacterium]
MEQAIGCNNLKFYATEVHYLNFLLKMQVTFVTNHDTEKDTKPENRIGTAENQLLAYAYILAHPGYPCIFYLD